MKKIILASSSPRRKELLEKAGYVFDVVPSEYEEDMTKDMSPFELAKCLSRGKAEDVLQKVNEDAFIVAADTFIIFGKEVLGKPTSPLNAREMLRRLSGKEHKVITGFTIIDVKTQRIFSDAVVSTIFFREITEEEIDVYIATGEPLDKAGAYAIQGEGKKFVRKIEGDLPDIIGLPMKKLAEQFALFE